MVAAVAGLVTLPSGEKSIPVTSAPPAVKRLIVDQVTFTPNPVTSRGEPIHVRIRVTDTKGNLVRGALVFIRSTPLVASMPDRRADGAGRVGHLHDPPGAGLPAEERLHVQFFVKAYRQGDPTLAGISGTRLVQVEDHGAVRPGLRRAGEPPRGLPAAG